MTSWPKPGRAKNRDRLALAEDSLPWPGINGLPRWCAFGVMLPIATSAGPSRSQAVLPVPPLPDAACITGESSRLILDNVVLRLSLPYPRLAVAFLVSCWDERPRCHAADSSTRCAVDRNCSFSSCCATRSLAVPGWANALTACAVVQSKDGKTPLTNGQGIVRWLSQFIPIFNLVDVSVPYPRSLDASLRRPLGRYASDRHRAKARQRSRKDRAAIDQEGSSASAGSRHDHGGACSDCLTTDARKLSTPWAGRGSSPLVSRISSQAPPRFPDAAAAPVRFSSADTRSASEIASFGIAANWSAGKERLTLGRAPQDPDSSESVSTGSWYTTSVPATRSPSRWLSRVKSNGSSAPPRKTAVRNRPPAAGSATVCQRIAVRTRLA